MSNLATQIRAAVEGGDKSLFTELLSQAADLLDHKDTQINTRPAAPVEGLAILERVSKYPHGTYFGKDVPEGTAVVALSQAEAIIAAERKNTAEAIREGLKAVAEVRANNAALTARVNELEQELTDRKHGGRWSEMVEALENQLTSQAAQYKDLEDYAREATKAITGLTGGGSENFSKQIGELFTADLPLCLERIRERYVSKVEVKRLEKKLAAAKKALEWYANPEIYKPHPHGPAFDNRDVSYVARAALEAKP